MKRFLTSLCLLVSFLTFVSFLGPVKNIGATEPDISQYTWYPIFMTQSSTPNVMIILDNSGSMNEPAYGVWANPVVDQPYTCGVYNMAPQAVRDIVEELPSYPSKNGINYTQDAALDLARAKISNVYYNNNVGLRYLSIPIPQGATITNAYISFTGYSALSTATSVKIYGHAVGVSPTFTSGTFASPVVADYNNLSNRARTTANVTWTIPTWAANGTGASYDTPSLTAIVQEIVNRSDWQQGNPMSFYITNNSPGSGQRQGKAALASAPILHIEYQATCQSYYGYFDPTSRYTYSSNKFVRSTSGEWSGDWLNWVCMRKIDVVRKVMVGGLATSRTGGGNTTLIGESPQSGSNAETWTKWFWEPGTTNTPYSGYFKYYMTGGNMKVYNWSGTLQATYKIEVQKDSTAESNDFVDGNIAGVLQKVGNKARWGNMWFYTGTGNNQEGGFVSNSIDSGNLTSMVTDLENQNADTWTPLSETLFVCTQYFKQKPVNEYGDVGIFANAIGPIGNQNDPYYDKSKSVYSPCSKSFVILLTDGMSTKDTRVPQFIKDMEGYSCDEYSSPGSCPYASSGTDYLRQVALWAHTTDLRGDLSGTQSMNLYVVYAFGNDQNAQNLLMDAAKNGGFVDKNSNNLPDLQEEWDLNSTGIPYNYFEADNGYLLESQLIAAITDILKRASSGTAVSVLATSAEGEGTLTQAYFKPTVSTFINNQTVDAKWIGYLQALWVDSQGNIREDTLGNQTLDLAQNKIVEFFFDTTNSEASFYRYAVDSNGNKAVDGGGNYIYTKHLMGDIQPLWEAGSQLSTRDPSTRTIKTWVDLNNNGAVDTGEFVDFNITNLASIQPFLGVADSAKWAYMGASPNTVSDRASNLVKFILGYDTGFTSGTNLRYRSVNGFPWKLGDIIDSTPVTIGRPTDRYDVIYGDAAYVTYYLANKNRDQVVYVGSNYGMLHAFYMGHYNTGPRTTGGTEDAYFTTSGPAYGQELWGYIPQALLPHLKWLADPNYTHVYYVDLKPRVVDAKIFGAAHDQYGTVLLLGLNLGGKSISVTDAFPSGTPQTRTFTSSISAINITDPFNPVLMWEKTFSNIGLTTSEPNVIKVGSNWYAVVGSGPTYYDGSSSQTGALFVLDLATGQKVGEYASNEALSFFGSPIGVDYGLNFNVDKVYVGETVATTSPAPSLPTDWKHGRLYRLHIPKLTGDPRTSAKTDTYNTNPSAWTFGPMMDAAGPITAAPAASIDKNNNLWVYFGTGRYFASEDKTDTTTQYFYGIKDPYYNSAMYSSASSGLAKSPSSFSRLDTTYASVYTDQTVTGIAGVSSWSDLITKMAAMDGWILQLGTGSGNTGERELNKPIVLGGAVYDTTFVPTQDPCGYSGNSNLIGLYYETGTAYTSEVFSGGTQTVTVSGQTKTLVLTKANVGYGKASGVTAHVGQESGATGYVQQSTGIVQGLKLSPPFKIRSGFLNWRER